MLYINKFRIAPDLPDAYFSALPAVRAIQRMGWFDLRSPVTMFVGENGSGKSTLLEALAVCAGMNAEGGSRNFNFASAKTHSELCNYITLARAARESDSFFLRAESLYNAATYMDELDQIAAPTREIKESYGGKSLHEQSHGESFLSLVHNRLHCGLYIWDEPEAALSPTRQMTLLAEMHRLVQAGSQLIVATHAPILMAFPGAEIYELTEYNIRLTPYHETAHYQVTKRFLCDPQHMLQILLD